MVKYNSVYICNIQKELYTMYFSHSGSETSDVSHTDTENDECMPIRTDDAGATSEGDDRNGITDNAENDEFIINRFEEEGIREYDDEDDEHYSIDTYEYNHDAIDANTRSLYRRLLADLIVEPETQDNTIVPDYFGYYGYDDLLEGEEEWGDGEWGEWGESSQYYIQRIYEKEYLFLDSEKVNNKYYIGVYTILDDRIFPHSIPESEDTPPSPFEIVLGSCISPSTFFEFPINNVQQYLSAYSIIYSDRLLRKSVDILKLCISERDGTYTVIVKTTWLRMFQRKWRKICAEKKRDMEHRMKLSSMRHFEVYGKWPPK